MEGKEGFRLDRFLANLEQLVNKVSELQERGKIQGSGSISAGNAVAKYGYSISTLSRGWNQPSSARSCPEHQPAEVLDLGSELLVVTEMPDLEHPTELTFEAEGTILCITGKLASGKEYRCKVQVPYKFKLPPLDARTSNGILSITLTKE